MDFFFFKPSTLLWILDQEWRFGHPYPKPNDKRNGKLGKIVIIQYGYAEKHGN